MQQDNQKDIIKFSFHSDKRVVGPSVKLSHKCSKKAKTGSSTRSSSQLELLVTEEEPEEISLTVKKVCESVIDEEETTTDLKGTSRKKTTSKKNRSISVPVSCQLSQSAALNSASKTYPLFVDTSFEDNGAASIVKQNKQSITENLSLKNKSTVKRKVDASRELDTPVDKETKRKPSSRGTVRQKNTKPSKSELSILEDKNPIVDLRVSVSAAALGAEQNLNSLEPAQITIKKRCLRSLPLERARVDLSTPGTSSSLQGSESTSAVSQIVKRGRKGTGNKEREESSSKRNSRSRKTGSCASSRYVKKQKIFLLLDSLFYL